MDGEIEIWRKGRGLLQAMAIYISVLNVLSSFTHLHEADC